MIRWIVLAYVGVSLYQAIRRPDSQYRAVATAVRPRHVVRALPWFVAVIVASVVLMQIPGLSWGWWQSLGGSGSIATGMVANPTSALDRWIPVVVLAMLALAVPTLAIIEERMFRRGSEDRTTAGRVRRAILFGSVHALMGIPIGVALALSLGGWYFTREYVRAYRRAFRRSTGEPVYHQLAELATGPTGTRSVVEVTSGFDVSVVVSDARRAAERSALLASATAHTAWNWLIAAIALTAAIVNAIGG